MTLFTDADFKDVTTHDGFISRDKDFTAALEEITIKPLGKKDSLALSLRFSDDPDGEKLLNIFGIDQAKEGSYNKKMSFGAFIESLAKCGIKTQVASKIKGGTNMDNPAIDYQIRFTPDIKGKTLSMHIEISKYTKDSVEKESQTWTVASIGGESTTSASPVKPTDNSVLIQKWRVLIVDPIQMKNLGLPGTKKNLILNLKKVISDEKIVSAMQTVRDEAMNILATEGLVTIDEKGVITPT